MAQSYILSIYCPNIFFKITLSLLQSIPKLQHQQVHGDDFLSSSHMLLQQYVVGGSSSWGELAEKRKECRKPCSLDNPSDMLGTRLSDSLHQKVYCCKVLHICSVLIISVFSCPELFFIERFSINGHFGGDIQWKCF